MKPRKSRRPRILIGGYAGCGNLGDDAALSGILEGLFRAGGLPQEIMVLSGDPRRDQKRFGVRCAGRKNPFLVVLALLRADVFILGGGTLLQMRTGKRSPLYYLLLLRLARLFGCRTFLLGGLDELFDTRICKIAQKELAKCSGLLLRDEYSQRRAQEMNLQEKILSAGADPAFLLPLPSPLRAAFLTDRLVGDLKKPFLCICPCGGVTTGGISELLRSSFSGFFPVYLLCDPARDTFPARRLQREFGGVLYAPRDAGEAMALFSAAQLVVSCRLHPLILSVRVGARCVCFSGGDPKLAAFCQSAGILLFGAEQGSVILPPAAAFLSRPVSDSTVFCQMAAKDLAILCEMVYNGTKETPSATKRGKGRKFHEKRAVGGSAPPNHH